MADRTAVFRGDMSIPFRAVDYQTPVPEIPVVDYASWTAGSQYAVLGGFAYFLPGAEAAGLRAYQVKNGVIAQSWFGDSDGAVSVNAGVFDNQVFAAVGFTGDDLSLEGFYVMSPAVVAGTGVVDDTSYTYDAPTDFSVSGRDPPTSLFSLGNSIGGREIACVLWNFNSALLENKRDKVYALQFPKNTNEAPYFVNAFVLPREPAEEGFFSCSSCITPGSSTISTLFGFADTGEIYLARWLPTQLTFSNPDLFFDEVFTPRLSDHTIDDVELVNATSSSFGFMVPAGDGIFYHVNPQWTEYRRVVMVPQDAVATDIIVEQGGGLPNCDNYGNYISVDGLYENDEPRIIWSFNTLIVGDNGVGPPGGWWGAPFPVPNPDMNRLRAWPMTFDGHTVYVLRLGQDGTVVYDTKTEQWCDWGSSGQAGWRISFGGNWVGQQIVGGDNLEGLLWNIDPNEKLDDGEPITSYITGLVTHRGLDAAPCDGFLVTGQLGDFPLPTGVSLLLQTSDDSGNNFVDQGTLSVAADDQNQPQWLSLGQIIAPGRVFRLSEAGGMARIEGFGMW